MGLHLLTVAERVMAAARYHTAVWADIDPHGSRMRLTVIIPSLDQRRFLDQTLRSVLEQEGVGDRLRVEVVDGGSRDGSVELLQSIRDPRLRWTSEPDRGQADAVNKGLSRADGDIVAWLNSDDLYEPGALATVLRAFETHDQAQWLVGDCRVVDESGRTIRPLISAYKRRRLQRYRLDTLLRENFISQMSVFWRQRFGNELAYGPDRLLDESLHYCMDYDLWLRMAQATSPLIVGQTLACFRLHRSSKSGRVNREQFDEQYRVACRYLSNRPLLRLVHRLNVEKTVWAYRMLRSIRL